jgi:hypothetical protein
LADLEYVKVLEGWVVTSWGSASVEELLREGAGEVLESGTAKSSGAKAGTGKKRKVVAKPQLASKAADTRPSSANENESVSEEASEDGGQVNGYTEPASLETPGAKHQKILRPEECAASFSEEHAAVRAAALGLRARKWGSMRVGWVTVKRPSSVLTLTYKKGCGGPLPKTCSSNGGW